MDYGVMDYGDMNWLAIVCAGLAYWLLGAVWYSALFSKARRSAVEQHGPRRRSRVSHFDHPDSGKLDSDWRGQNNTTGVGLIEVYRDH